MRTDFGMRTDLGMRTDFHDANALAVAKADANMNKTVAVLLKMNLSPAKLSEGIRLAVQEADKYRLSSRSSTPSSVLTRSDSRMSCSSESNFSGNYSNYSSDDGTTSAGRRTEIARRSKWPTGSRKKSKRRPRAKNVNTPAAQLAKKVCGEFLLSRRVWTALYDGNNRISDYRLDVVLRQIAPNMTEPEQAILKNRRAEVIRRIKRVLGSLTWEKLPHKKGTGWKCSPRRPDGAHG